MMFKARWGIAFFELVARWSNPIETVSSTRFKEALRLAQQLGMSERLAARNVARYRRQEKHSAFDSAQSAIRMRGWRYGKSAPPFRKRTPQFRCDGRRKPDFYETYSYAANGVLGRVRGCRHGFGLPSDGRSQELPHASEASTCVCVCNISYAEETCTHMRGLLRLVATPFLLHGWCAAGHEAKNVPGPANGWLEV